MIERTILFCSADQIEATDLPAELRCEGDGGAAAASGIGSGRLRAPSHPGATGEMAVVGGAGALSSGAPAGPAGGGDSGQSSLKEMVRAETSRVEKELIARALDETGGNVTQAAKLLKISRKSLQMKMKEFGLRDREAGA